MIPFDKAKEEAEGMGVTLFETSAFNGSNIEDIFRTLVLQIKAEQADFVSITASGMTFYTHAHTNKHTPINTLIRLIRERECGFCVCVCVRERERERSSR